MAETKFELVGRWHESDDQREPEPYQKTHIAYAGEIVGGEIGDTKAGLAIVRWLNANKPALLRALRYEAADLDRSYGELR